MSELPDYRPQILLCNSSKKKTFSFDDMKRAYCNGYRDGAGDVACFARDYAKARGQRVRKENGVKGEWP